MNLNILAKEITLREGLKKSVNIAQVKEVMKIIFTAVSNMTIKEINSIIMKYSKKGAR